MFGTIGHVCIKPGHLQQLKDLTAEWQRTIRPGVPGPVISLSGHVAGDPEAGVFIALMQDEQTYRALAGKPEQDAWYRRLLEHVDGEVTWEDVELEVDSLQ